MWEFDIVHNDTNESRIMFGYNEADAFRRSGYDPNEYIVVGRTYID